MAVYIGTAHQNWNGLGTAMPGQRSRTGTFWEWRCQCWERRCGGDDRVGNGGTAATQENFGVKYKDEVYNARREIRARAIRSAKVIYGAVIRPEERVG